MNPSQKQKKLEKSIKKEIENMRQIIQTDGGDIKFESFDHATGIVKVTLYGACVGCPMSAITLQDGVLTNLQYAFEEVKGIELSEKSFPQLIRDKRSL